MDKIIGVIIALIVLSAVFYKKIVGLFANYILSKILSIISGVIAIAGTAITIYMGYYESSGGTVEAEWAVVNLAAMFSAFFFTILSWLFFIGPSVFDYEWDGTFLIRIDEDDYTITPRTTGGFIGNFVTSSLVYFCILMVGGVGTDDGESIGVLALLMPIVITIMSAFRLFKAWRDSR